MKKTILALILVLLCIPIFSQQTWFVNNPKGLDFYLTTTVDDDVITGMTRKNALIDIVGRFQFTIAKMTTDIIYPEIVHFEGDLKGNSFKGSYQMLFDQLNFNATIENDSLSIILYEDNKTIELKGAKVDQIVSLRNYKKTVNKLIQLTEEDSNNYKYLNTRKWSVFKKEIREISPRINDDFELEIAFGGIAKNLRDELIEIIKEYTRKLLNIE